MELNPNALPSQATMTGSGSAIDLSNLPSANASETTVLAQAKGTEGRRNFVAVDAIRWASREGQAFADKIIEETGANTPEERNIARQLAYMMDSSGSNGGQFTAEIQNQAAEYANLAAMGEGTGAADLSDGLWEVAQAFIDIYAQ
ncbi:MAG: hypothetical protein AB8C46_24360 [Burkholderiaceae bacterium]